MKSKLGYLGIMAVTLAAAVLQQSEFPRFLLGFEFLLACGLFWNAWKLGKNLHISLRIPQAVAHRGETFSLEAEVSNTCRLPVPAVDVTIWFRDLQDGQEGKACGTAMAEGRGRALLCFCLAAPHCGVIEVYKIQAVVSDYMGIFRRRCRSDSHMFQVSVLPRLEAESGTDTAAYMGGKDERPGGRGADDPTEMQDIRTFRSGDTLHLIHWKLSAKSDELLVRQPDRISGRPAVILADRGTQEGQTVERDVWDEFLGTVGELSLALLGCHTPHYVAWLDGETGRVARSFVENEDGTEQMLISLLRTADHRSVNLRELYEESFEDAKLEEVFRVDWEGKIHRETDRECDRRC